MIFEQLLFQAKEGDLESITENKSGRMFFALEMYLQITFRIQAGVIGSPR